MGYSPWGQKESDMTEQLSLTCVKGFPGGTSGKEPACQCRIHIKKCRFDRWVGKILWRRAWPPTPVFLPRESHGQRRLADYSLYSCKELDMTQATWHTCILFLKPVKKAGLKFIQKTKIMAPCPITSWQKDEDKVETVTDFCSPLGLQSHCGW